ncbi:MAG TPA: DUF3089 domain-containing protein [Acidimicrobiales bacterium]|nr:DUF3089 domain-containing protein [Acidimicrobiales bacterium]
MRGNTSEGPARARVGLGTALVLLALVAAACGGGSKSSAAAPAGRRTTTTAATSTSTGAAVSIPSAPTNTVWLCKPGVEPDPCAGGLDSTVVAGDGSRTVKKASVATDPKIDCFYVYPTVSTQPTINANLHVDPEETGVAVAQTARFSQVCHVYAPMYRQLTLKAISGRGNITPQAGVIAYTDVQNAWLDYLAHYNHGRGVVLIGHSQGAGMLTRLIKAQIDPNAAQRKLLVSAILLGGNVTVPIGKTVGGSFSTVPACTKDSQTGCVVAYSSFLDPPPADSLFGRSRTAGQQVLCTNPAALGGGSAVLHPEFPTKAGGAVGSLIKSLPSASTPWVTYSDLYEGRCVDQGGASWLQVTPTPAPGDTRPVVTEQIGPTWGLHLVDVNITFEDLVDLVRQQIAAYTG